LKAVRLEKGGKPELREVEVPRELRNDQVLIRLQMTGICYRDLLTVDGFFPNTKYPITLGHEITGTIEKVGNEVKGFKVGERVVSLIYEPCGECESCISGKENLCRKKKTFGEDVDGSYAEYIAVSERALVKVPPEVSAEGAAISACVTGMLLHAFRRASLSSGETVLITGAGGGVGIHAVQIAKAIGCRVIASTTSSWKSPRIRESGADEVIEGAPSPSTEVKKLTGGKGVDVVLESVGTPTLSESLRSLAWGGRMVVVGNVDPRPTDMSLGLIILRENSILGSVSSTRKEVEEALRMTAEGKIRPVIHTILNLEQAERGHEMMRKRESLGRVLLKP
jgi:acryloyl-coenzyme A reductase